MANFEIKCSKTKDQQTITIKHTDLTDISTLTTVSAKVYTSDLATPINTYVFTAQNLTDLKAGSVDIATLTLLGITDDDWYKIILDGDTLDSDSAGVSITLEAAGKVYANQGKVDVYSPDYRTDKVLHVIHFLYQEMNSIEDLDPSDQKRVDFTTRLALLQQILNYS
jgi:hypothetical protein